MLAPLVKAAAVVFQHESWSPPSPSEDRDRHLVPTHEPLQFLPDRPAVQIGLVGFQPEDARHVKTGIDASGQTTVRP